MQQAPVFILTGERASGKTSFLMRLIQILKLNGLQLKGFYAVGYWKNKRRSKFDLVDISTGHRILLCKTESEKDWPRHPPYYFNPEAIGKGTDILNESMSNKADLTITDEVGKLEIKGHIWYQPLKELVNKGSGPMLWVIRKAFVEEALESFKIEKACILDIGHLTPQDASRIIQHQLYRP